MEPSLATKCALTLLLISLASCCSNAFSPSSNRHNLFDPIFAYDDIDAHTVTAALDQNLAGNGEKSQISTRTAQDPGRQFELSRASSMSADKLASAVPTFGTTTDTRKPKKIEPEHHWSALENYYQKLRNSAAQKSHETTGHQLPVYQVVEQEIHDPLSDYKPIHSYSPAATSISDISKKQSGFNSSPKSQAFLLPIIYSSKELPVYDQDFGFSVHRRPSGISQTSGSDVTSGRSRAQKIEHVAVRPQSQSVPFSSPEDGRVKYLEWRKLPELLLIQQQQQRAKHQQETFGSWYDHKRSRELLQEEAFCGPRNYISFHISPVGSASGGSGASANLAQLEQISVGLPKSNPRGAVDEPTSDLNVPVALSAGEYPSHMGVYNDSKTEDGTFLCSATWIHERFALTLASCVSSIDREKLIVRAGEWNLNKNNTGERPMITREIKQVSIFPKYRQDHHEHNLALLEFTKPLDYLETPFVCPACQIQSRSSIRTSSCWAPVKNTTVSEYFDPEGEGETKERRVVSVVELPVRLFANDDTECYRETKVEFFNFQHPNYICSADYRLANWRARLNQTDYFGSGIYCNEGGNLSLVSIIHPIHPNSPSTYGYLDLSYYRPWMRNIISGRSY